MIEAPSKPVAKLQGSPLLDLIGNTPLLRLDRLSAHLPGIQILGKAEWRNPGGSVKDRAASSIVAAARRSGQLGPSKILMDATSGNTGIAYAMLGAAMGFPVLLCMPSNVSVERKRILAAYGAEVLWTDPGDGSDGAIRMAQKLIAESPEKYFYADQYGNDNNWRAHYYGTANEIWNQTDGKITHFVAALGTSGTFMGNTRRLRELNPEIQCISMQPDSPFNGLEGLKHMATAIVPPIYDPTSPTATLTWPPSAPTPWPNGSASTRACSSASPPQPRSPRLSRSPKGKPPPNARPSSSPSSATPPTSTSANTSGPNPTKPTTHWPANWELENWQLATLNQNRPMSLQIPQALYDQLRAHGEETYPHECCGIMLGNADDDDLRVAQLIRAGNTRTDSAHNRYNIAPQELIAAQREGRKQGLDIVGFYHSHPDHPAQWSPTDFAEAHWFGCAYVITSTDGDKITGHAKITNSFLLTGTGEEDKAFTVQLIEVT